jgi:hypothetical protein
MSMPAAMQSKLSVTVNGSNWEDDSVDMLRERLERLVRSGGRLVLHAHLRLGHVDNSSSARPYLAAVTLDVNGDPVYASVDGINPGQTSSTLQERVRVQLEHLENMHATMRGGGRRSMML